ncbi:hypothetical protein [Streptomyces sindenensis]|uniref:Uncharacterized protein n=1 Tax=Streptomyces sindenensis TaxID=67363 RepID=A0ABW6ET32_9ACTN
MNRQTACGAVVQLTLDTITAVRQATALSGGAGLPELIHTVLRCPLQRHPADVDHQALVSELFARAPGDIWAAWAGQRQPHTLTEADYCTAENGPASLCLLVERHHGAHSWELAPPAPRQLTAAWGTAA